MPKAPLQMQDFYGKIFSHFQKLPPKSIQEAVILVSCRNLPQTVYQTILQQAGKRYQTSDSRIPSFDKATKILHATQWFLKPEQGQNFITMYYLCHYVKRAKFLFIINDQDTKPPMKNIRMTLSNFFSLIKSNITQKQIEQLIGPSCGIVVFKPNSKRQVYKYRLSSMCNQQDYLKNQSSKFFLNYLLDRENQFLLLNPKNTSTTFALSGIIGELKYLQLPQYSQIRLNSCVEEFINEKFQQKWQKYFFKLYANLQTLVRQTHKESYQEFMKREQKKQSNYIQIVLKNKLEEFRYTNSCQQFKDQQTISSLRLINFLTKYLEAVFMMKKDMTEPQFYRQALKVFLEGLQSSRFLRRTNIKQFLLSIYQIFQFLSSKFSQTTYIDLTAILFNPKYIDQYMYNFLQLLQKLIIQELDAPGSKYPFDRVIIQLSSFTSQLQQLKQTQYKFDEKFSFFTPRIEQKLKTLHLELAYAKTLSQSRYHNISRSQLRNNWLHFLELQPHKNKISEAKVEQILQYVGLQLTQAKCYYLALQVFNLNWRRFSNRIIEIYERDYNFSLELVKYSFNRGGQNKKKQFQEYCKFLAKIDFSEKLNALCLQAFRWIKDKQYIQELKQNLRDERNKSSNILDDQNVQDTRIQVNQWLMASIRYQFKRMD